MTVLSLSGRVTLSGATLFDGSLSVAAGWTCLMGPSGTGKTTLLRLLAGLPVAAHFDGQQKRPDRIGWMAQSDLLLGHLTVARNVTLVERLAGRAQPADRVTACLEAVGLTGFEARMPDTLSGGQRQRVALARALMQDAPCYLLDEPFAALDPATRAKVQTTARTVLAGRTVLIVTHDPTEALRLADRLVVLAGGGLHEIALSPSAPENRGSDARADALRQIIDAMETA